MRKAPVIPKKKPKQMVPSKPKPIDINDYAVVMLRGLTDEELAEIARVRR